MGFRYCYSVDGNRGKLAWVILPFGDEEKLLSLKPGVQASLHQVERLFCVRNNKRFMGIECSLWDGRPLLVDGLDRFFLKKHYYLKKELMDFCRQVGLSTVGNKQDLTERIGLYLETGDKVLPSKVDQVRHIPEKITLETRIEKNIVCSEKHRAFFKQVVGPSFTFLVPFQKWLKEHAGSTYAEAVCEWYELKKQKSRVISGQFEYNAYIREFFQDNPGKSLQEAVRCWSFKKRIPGNHQYSRKDLQVLSERNGPYKK